MSALVLTAEQFEAIMSGDPALGRKPLAGSFL